MIEFIKNFYLYHAIPMEGLNKFIIEYCEMCNKPITSAVQLQIISQAILLGQFDLDYAVDNYVYLKNYKVTKLFNENKQIIQVYIE